MRKTLSLFLAALCCLTTVSAAEKMRTDMRNLVVFVSFYGEKNAFVNTPDHYENLYNDSTEGANSVYNYFYRSSYGQLKWPSTFWPKQQGSTIAYIQSKFPRAYFEEKGSLNDYGYTNEVEKSARELALIKDISSKLGRQLPATVDIDADGDGFIDNVTFVISGRSGISSDKLLWPHRSDLILPDEQGVYVHGKKLVSYIVVFDQSNGYNTTEDIPINTGVLCHEMSHTLGTFDLYHAADKLNPVGVWDLMANNQIKPQQMLVYTKMRYCHWIDSVPTISKPGTYTLYPVGSKQSNKVAYKIKPTGSDEYFMVEYRKQTEFDSSIPASGMLIYRINPNLSRGNLDYNGTTRLDETYVFRPNGSTTDDGNITDAVFSSDYGRSSFGVDPGYGPFYGNGEKANFAIDEISACGDSITFRLKQSVQRVFVGTGRINLSGGNGSEGSLVLQSDQSWEVKEMPEWIDIDQKRGGAGSVTLKIVTTSENDNVQPRSGRIIIVGREDDKQTDTIIVNQTSNLLQAPTALVAEVQAAGVQISWTQPIEGKPILKQDFESEADFNLWTVVNSDNRGWRRQMASKYQRETPYQGSYSAGMVEAFEDLRQDEQLISPTFAQGSILSFWSESIAPRMGRPITSPTIMGFHYDVEVSSDGGQTWHVVYDLMREGTKVNAYEQVVVGLDKYQSDNMKVRFHAWDEGLGLSYWWTVDNIAVYGKPENSLVKGYAIYRNGERIGESTTTSFVDRSPLQGNNVYTVTAISDGGETVESKSVSVDYNDVTSIEAPQTQLLVLNYHDGRLTVTTSSPVANISVYAADGVAVARVSGLTVDVPANRLLIVRVTMADGSTVTRKLYTK